MDVARFFVPMHFEIALEHTLGIEGGLSDDPRDSGRKTTYGTLAPHVESGRFLSEPAVFCIRKANPDLCFPQPLPHLMLPRQKAAPR